MSNIEPTATTSSATTVTVSRRIQFSAGHRVMGHEGKCAHLHGHNFTVILHASGHLDSLGRVVDFSALKDCIGAWVEEHWDHGFIVFREDAEAIAALARVRNQKVYLLPNNPTAENLATHLLQEVCPWFLAKMRVHRVEVWETDNCKAEASL